MRLPTSLYYQRSMIAPYYDMDVCRHCGKVVHTSVYDKYYHLNQCQPHVVSDVLGRLYRQTAGYYRRDVRYVPLEKKESVPEPVQKYTIIDDIMGLVEEEEDKEPVPEGDIPSIPSAIEDRPDSVLDEINLEMTKVMALLDQFGEEQGRLAKELVKGLLA